MEANYPYAIKNQRGASKIPLVGGILRSKAPIRGLWMPELVLYDIRLLSKKFLGTVLGIEVDQSGLIDSTTYDGYCVKCKLCKYKI